VPDIERGGTYASPTRRGQSRGGAGQTTRGLVWLIFRLRDDASTVNEGALARGTSVGTGFQSSISIYHYVKRRKV